MQMSRKGNSLNQAKLLRSEGDLYNLGVFDWASVAATGGDTDQAEFRSREFECGKARRPDSAARVQAQ